MISLYSRPADLPSPPFPLVAIDCETERFKEPKYDINRKTRHTRFEYPRLIFGQIARAHNVYVFRPIEFSKELQRILGTETHLVFHNSPFDIGVIFRELPNLRSAFLSAITAGRVHDTLILEQLIQIARGSDTIDAKVVKAPKLVDLAKRRCGMTLIKDESVRLEFGAFSDPAFEVPQQFLTYAADDAEATYRVFCNQWREAQLYDVSSNSEHAILAGARANFGLLTETIQVKGALALAWLEQFPLRVDLSKLEAIRTRLLEETGHLETALIAFGWAKRTPKLRRFSVSHKQLRTILATYASEHNLRAPRSASGLLSLQYDFWAAALPPPDSRLRDSPERASNLEEQASVWLHYQRVHKLLATYIEPYSTSPTHHTTYYNLGARTGRTSSVRPNIQNIPKHKWGIRSLFVPRAGYTFVEGDFKAAELVGLAQTYKLLFGGSLLGDAINAGLDPHIETAKRLFGSRWETLTDNNRKLYRQAAKAINFGLPGGLGAAKFKLYANRSYGLKLTDSEAKSLRDTALGADPQLHAYLTDSLDPEAWLTRAAHNLGLTLDALITALQCWQDRDTELPHLELACSRLRKWSFGDDRFEIPIPVNFDRRYDLHRSTASSPTGFVRGRASFTELHNLPFQNLVACGAKLAAWELYKAWTPESTWQPAAFIHDSFLIDTSSPTPDGALLKSCMEAGLKAVCPDILVGVDLTEPTDTWGKTTL